MLLNMSYKKEYPEHNEACELFMDIIKNANCHNIAEENNFVSTGQALFYLSFQINRICDSMLLCLMGDYAIVILYRSIIEHFVKHFYIFLRFHKEHNDNVGEQYYFDCIYEEQVKKMNAFLWPNFFKAKLDMKQYHKQIRSNAENFSFREILNYMGEINFPDISGSITITKLIQKMKMDYSLCSSYTHGGPEAISMRTQIPKENIQHSSVSYSILAQLQTIRTFTNFDSPTKERLKEVQQRMEELLEISYRNWDIANEGE
jgi:hypothetical protein